MEPRARSVLCGLLIANTAIRGGFQRFAKIF